MRTADMGHRQRCRISQVRGRRSGGAKAPSRGQGCLPRGTGWVGLGARSLSICHVTKMTSRERPLSRRTGDTETKVYRRPGGAAAVVRRSGVCVGGACELAGREVGFWGWSG